jgi:hypothetical protein
VVNRFLDRPGRAICYALGVGFFAVLAAWAKNSSTGMAALVAGFVATVAFVCILRWRWGYWPGDEHRVRMTPEERRRSTFRALAGIGIMLALAVVAAVTVALL